MAIKQDKDFEAHGRFMVDQFGLHVVPDRKRSTKTGLVVTIKRRSMPGRLKRLPKYMVKNWQFSKGAPLLDRISFCFHAVKTLLL
jgi:hypothetical protein